ncbi:MAG: amidohydrolase family protein [Eubacteriales bacterium]|nr:amidohydrolase family protein [Eubacteriales bacterium]
MVIDVHYHPAFIKEVCPDEETAEVRRNDMAYYKTPRCALEQIEQRLSASGVDRCFLLPHDYSGCGGDAMKNEDIKKLVDLGKGRFYGFASIDPGAEDALEKLEYAFAELGLSGLKLHPCRQRFYPNEERMFPIYELCERYDKPIIFHSGFTWQPDSPAKYGHPLLFEEVAMKYPKLRMCLAHMGFPWVKDTAMLLLKYPNLYADTGVLFFDCAREFYEHIFTKEIGIGWLDRSIRHQVMFGSNMPRFEQMRMLTALKNLGLREETVELITERNALEFLGEEERSWLG